MLLLVVASREAEVFMKEKLMVLPSTHFEQIRVVSIPNDLDASEAFRYATGIIAQAEESEGDYSWDDIAEALEARGFIQVDVVLGPELD
jgi:hypothetical protein